MAFATDERLALANQGIFIRVLLLQTCARLQQSYSSPKFQRGSDVLNGLYAVVGQFPSTIGQLLYFVVLCHCCAQHSRDIVRKVCCFTLDSCRL